MKGKVERPVFLQRAGQAQPVLCFAAERQTRVLV